MSGYDPRYAQRGRLPGSEKIPPPELDKSDAKAALALGIIAMTLPIPFFGIFFGIFGLLAVRRAYKEKHYTGGMLTAGLILSILGTINTVATTIACTTMAFSSM